MESVNTLKFAQRASKVVTKAERGVILGESGALIAKYEKELDELRARLQRNDSKGRDPITDEHLEDERSKVRELPLLTTDTSLASAHILT